MAYSLVFAEHKWKCGDRIGINRKVYENYKGGKIPWVATYVKVRKDEPCLFVALESVTSTDKMVRVRMASEGE